VTPLSILFQDEWLVAIDKPPGFLVHPSDQPKSDDLVAMKILRDQIKKNIRVIHRLDQPTSGVVIFATNCGAARKLRKDFEKRRVKKRYLAMIHGHPSREEWICQAPLKKNPDSPEKPAETLFRVLEKQAQQLALIEAFPNSGRFHQIRRHLLCSGHPIVGDFRYREHDLCKEFGERMRIGTRMLLQAKSLEFCHPITQVRLVIEAPIDPCIKHLAKI
jgi:tRNA pseudouridine65 synthase